MSGSVNYQLYVVLSCLDEFLCMLLAFWDIKTSKDNVIRLIRKRGIEDSGPRGAHRSAIPPLEPASSGLPQLIISNSD